MHTIILSVDEAKRLADGALAAAEKDGLTPIINAAKLTRAADGRVSLVATDRYRVHRMLTAELAPPTGTQPGGYPAWDEVETVIPYAGLKWLAANAKKLGHFATVVIEIVPWEDSVSPGSIAIEVRAGLPNSNGLLEMDRADGYLGYACRPVAGTFPPVDRLFADPQPPNEIDERGVLLEVNFLADLKKLKRYSSRRGEPARVLTSRKSQSGRPGAVRFEFADNGKVYADALIMPNLDLR